MPLHRAALEGRIERVRALLEQGADMEATDRVSILLALGSDLSLLASGIDLSSAVWCEGTCLRVSNLLYRMGGPRCTAQRCLAAWTVCGPWWRRGRTLRRGTR